MACFSSSYISLKFSIAAFPTGAPPLHLTCRLSMRYTTFLIPVKVKHPWLAEEQRNRAEARTTARSILTQSWSSVFKWLQMPSDHVVFKATNMGKPWHQTDTNAHFFSVSLGHLTLKKKCVCILYALSRYSLLDPLTSEESVLNSLIAGEGLYVSYQHCT